jgi:oligosaccharide repeat unit polymerase
MSDPRVPSITWGAAAACILLVGWIYADDEMVVVVLPLVIGLLVSTGFYWTLCERTGGSMPWFELGVVYTAVVTLYMAFPLMGFIALGGRYTPASDNRLLFASPGPREVASAAWLYTSHLCGFCATYLILRGRLRLLNASPVAPSFFTLLAVVVVYLLVRVFEVALDAAYDTSSGSYIASYLVPQRLPVLFAQLLNHLGGMKYPLSLAVLAILFRQYAKARPVILLWLLGSLAIAGVRLGSRTEVVLLLVAAASMYHTLVRPIPARLVWLAVPSGMAAFVAFGVLRGGTVSTGGHSLWNPFATATEFEVLFANVVDLRRLHDAGAAFPSGLFLADLTALVPRQLVPYTKIDPAAWYVGQYYPTFAAWGGGFAFGTMSEAVLTGGWLSALLRGGALGLVFAFIHREYVRRCDGFWMFVFYAWITTLSYQSFRNTTFSLAVLFVYRFVPTVLAVTVVERAVRAIAHPTLLNVRECSTQKPYGTF